MTKLATHNYLIKNYPKEFYLSCRLIDINTLANCQYDDARYIALCPCGRIEFDHHRCQLCNKAINQLVSPDALTQLQDRLIADSDPPSHLENLQVGILKCGHYFREKQLREYLKWGSTCPICREPIVPI